MAKATIPGLQTGGGLLRKVIGVVVVLGLLALVVKHPTDAGEFVKEAVGWLGDAVDSVAKFFRTAAG